MKGIIFCKRTVKEILRDPLSYVFCLGFPLIMLVIMSIVNKSIPAEANMTMFQIQNLAPGITYFGLSFVMLFICIQVSKDRNTALIMRLHASPMKSSDIIAGYTLSVVLLALLQIVITYAVSFALAMVTGASLSVAGIFVSILTLLPSAVMFIAFGLIFGTIVNEKAAPGVCSIIISAVGLIGGIWMDVDSIGGAILKVSKVLPFYDGVKASRLALAGQYTDMPKSLGSSVLWMAAVYLLAIRVMSGKLKKDCI